MELHEFEFLALEGQVDEKQGIIKGVSIITAGVQAKGHPLHTDLKTLEQMKTVANKAVQVPVKWNHKTGADAINGYLVNFYIDDNKLKADWHLLKKHERYEHALELATKMPKGMGLSASFRGKSEKVGNKMFARCSELPSVDLVASPAANPDGLFSEGVDNNREDMATKDKPSPAGGEEEVTLSAVLTAVQGLATKVDAQSDRLGEIEEFNSNLADSIEAEEQEFAAAEKKQADDELKQHQFENAEDPMVQFEARLAEKQEQIEFEAARQAQVTEFNELVDKLDKVVELNEALTAQNAAMAQTLGEMSDTPITFSASSDGNLKVVQSAAPADQTEFEARLAELQSGDEKMEAHDAVTFAISENEDRYLTHLSERGATA